MNAIPYSSKGINAFLAEYIEANKLSSNTIDLETTTIAAFVRKCAKMFMLPQNYRTSKFSKLIGEDLPAGSFTEEYFIDPVLPQDYDPLGADTMKPNDASFRPNNYAVSIDRAMLKITQRLDEFYPGVTDIGVARRLLTEIITAWSNSRDLWHYNLRRYVFGLAVGFIDQWVFGTTTTFAAGTAYAKGTYVRNNNTATDWGVIYQAYTANAATSWQDAIDKGYIVSLKSMKTELALPTTTTTTNAFINAVQTDVLNLQEPSQDYSFNGAALGIPESLTLYIKNSVYTKLKTESLAGAINRDELAIPARVEPVRDFGPAAPADVFAVLCDDRAVKVSLQFQKVHTQLNADGDFLNSVYHYGPLARLSKNAAFKEYKATAGE